MKRIISFLGLILLAQGALVPISTAKDFTFTWSRWSVVTEGVLQDGSTGLQWTQEDNGADIDWNSAMQYCQGSTWAGGGWRLPSVDELAAIYDANIPLPKVCLVYNGNSYTCKVSRLLDLTGTWYWSGTQDGSAEAWGVVLDDGYRVSVPVWLSNHHRALCVRRSEYPLSKGGE